MTHSISNINNYTNNILLPNIKYKQSCVAILFSVKTLVYPLDRNQIVHSITHNSQHVYEDNHPLTHAADLLKLLPERVCVVKQSQRNVSLFLGLYVCVSTDGDQCAEQPCKNGAMCSDSVGGYDCICKSGYSGVHCETDQTVCIIDKDKGCSHFCKPGYQSYQCSCALGWKLQQKEKCVPAERFPCGKVSSSIQWENRKSSNVRSEYQGLNCSAEECPWQAVLRISGSSGFCSGVILKDNLILTTAQCVRKYGDFEVAVGKRLLTDEQGEQILYVKQIHVHPLYMESKPDNDLAVVELINRIILKMSVLPACLPNRDLADRLMSEEYMGMVTGWKDSSELYGNLMLNHLSYDKLPTCVERHSGQVTNKMACTMPQPKADCIFGPGSPVVTLHREVFFLTGMVSQFQSVDCRKGYVLQKVSRFLPWLRPLINSL
ncbi:venom prothrombin activator vestarin-D1-like [Astyanax mexicanus]|uniref:Venom prothrombin activator vestarin-D1-like n=1 Tax=Astyanax mexicanus TaxID=7994 RepID=A0A8T2L4Q5_ASTMX|nr:venom prothrombin activator vestarin-D1-like [Astyanax mexicanus]